LLMSDYPEPVHLSISPGIESEFSGIYVAHWEVARFVIDVGCEFLGSKREQWSLSFPKGFELPGEAEEQKSRHHGPARFFRIRIVGVPSERGSFGHRGNCCREAEARRVLEISE